MYSEQEIYKLLNKFMDGQTSIEEEKEIGKWFAKHKNVAADLEDFRQMFVYFDQGMPLNSNGHMPDVVETKQDKVLSINKKTVLILAAACVAIVILMTSTFWNASPLNDRSQVACAAPIDSTSGRIVGCKTILPSIDSVENIKPNIRSNIKSNKKVRYHKNMYTPAPPKMLYAEMSKQAYIDSLADAIDIIVAQCVDEARSENEESYRQAMKAAAVYENAIIEETLVAAMENIY